MILQRLILASGLGILLAAPCSFAMTPLNPYLKGITNRNLFALKTAEEQADHHPAPALPAVKLSVITTVVGGKRAMLRVPCPARPPEPASELSLLLAEGAPAQEGVRVLEINVAAATVKIDNNGTVQTLDFEKDAPQSQPGSVPLPGATPRLRLLK